MTETLTAVCKNIDLVANTGAAASFPPVQLCIKLQTKINRYGPKQSLISIQSFSTYPIKMQHVMY